LRLQVKLLMMARINLSQYRKYQRVVERVP
jgi:hypothetical protein